MALFFILLVLLLGLLIAKHLVKDGLSRFVGICFILYWYGSLALSTFRPMGLDKVGGFTYFLLILGGISYVFGFVLAGKGRKVANVKYTKEYFEIKAEKVYTNLFFQVVLVLLIVYFMFYVREALIYSELMGRASRVNNGDDLYSDNTLFVTVYNYIGSIFFHLCNVLFWEGVINFKKKNIIPLVLLLLYILSYSILNGGRQIIVISLLYFLFLFFYNHNYKVKLSFKYVVLFVVLASATVYGIASISSFRSYGTYVMDSEEAAEGMNSAGEKVLQYSVLPSALFNYSLEHDFKTRLGGPYYGRATFAGLDMWIWAIMRYFIDYEPVGNTVVKYVQDNYFPISNEQESNYAYTALFYHYMDFGIIGVAFFPFLFGFIFRRLIFKYYNSGSVSLLVLLGFCYYMMMHAMFTCYLIKGWSVIYIIGLYVLYRFNALKRKQLLTHSVISPQREA